MEKISKIEILRKINLGDTVAENEKDEIMNYFVETEAWRMMVNGDKDIVYGSKGSGKSALYLLLMEQREKMKEKGIHLIAGEEVSDDPVFRVINDGDKRFTETEFRNLWKVYMLTLIGNYVKENLSDLDGMSPILTLLEKEGIIPATGLRRMLRTAISQLSKHSPTPTMETPDGIKYYISLEDTTLEEEKAGVVSVKDILRKIDDVLDKNDIKIWILFDRLDVAFVESDVETPALRALFRVYRDLSSFNSLKLKIFLRDDIWYRITKKEGFREQSHITRDYTLKWNKDSLKHLILIRFFSNQIIEEYIMPKNVVLGQERLQDAAFEIIFPKQVESGEKKPGTLDWMISRAQDGKQSPTPREIISLIKSAKEEQIHIFEIGGAGSEIKSLLSDNSLKSALEKVSLDKIKTLYSEYPDVRPFIEAFQIGKWEYTLDNIEELFASRGVTVKNLDDAVDRLVEIGFFLEKKGEEITYWIPFIFRHYLANH